MAVVIEIFIIIILIILNGFFSMAEFALVSARRVRLSSLAEKGVRGADRALALSEDPNTFLSTIQIGITLIGILAGAFGGAAIAGQISPYFSTIPYIGVYSGAISLLCIVLIITFLTLVFGELVPKRVGLAYPERISAAVAHPIMVIATLLAPLNHLASRSTEAILWLLGSRNLHEPPVTEEDITTLLEEGTQAGVFDEAEQELVESVFRFGDREVVSLMIPRPDIVYLDLEDSLDENQNKILTTRHTRYPVCKGTLDSIMGVISVRDLYAQTGSGNRPDIEEIIQEAMVIPEHITAIRLLELFRTAKTPMAVVMDEYGTVAGIITLHDLMEAIVGDLSTVDQEVEEPAIVKREDGSWFIDGRLPAEELRELLTVPALPGEEEGHFRTAAGFLISELGRVPSTGDVVIFDNFRLEVADMDDRRIDKILVSTVADQKQNPSLPGSTE